MGQLGFGRISLAYSPELNPAERVFEEVRRHIEGEVYPSLEAKRSAIEHLLRQLKVDKPLLKRHEVGTGSSGLWLNFPTLNSASYKQNWYKGRSTAAWPYDDTNDAVRLSQDPAMRVIVGWQGSERKGASTSEMGRFRRSS